MLMLESKVVPAGANRTTPSRLPVGALFTPSILHFGKPRLAWRGGPNHRFFFYSFAFHRILCTSRRLSFLVENQIPGHLSLQSDPLR